MVFPNIEKIKQEYTDKYVVVDAKRPELARFVNVVGQVKTVNMSGRALVEFLDYHLNIGWFDIELEFLKVVDKPQPKAKEEKKPAARAEVKKPEAKAAAPAAKPAAAGKPSTADILAKLKGGAGATPATPTAKKEETSKAEAKTAEESPTGPKVDRSKMSVADMLAAARSGAGGAPAAKSEPKPAPEAPAPVAEVTAPPKKESAPAAKSEGGIVKVDKSGMSVDEMVAYCREKDAR